MARGYRIIRVDGRKIPEHRHVMELKLGRKLTSAEIVHHADGNPLNNDPANLVILTRSQHQRLHACSSRRPWKIEETKHAAALSAAGMTIWEISLVLGRPFSTTARRLAKLAKETTSVSSLT
jgi:HNH endonuclease